MASIDDQRELGAWLQLMQTDGVGTETARRLLTAFGSPAQVLQAEIDQLRTIVSERHARALAAAPGAALQDKIERALQWAVLPGHRIMTLGDQDYPQALLNIADPPLLLYLIGHAELLSQPALAVVGSRNATTQGKLHAQRFSAALSHAGVTVVSGLALGIDAAAHEGGLRGIGASVAAIGTGIDIVYPACNGKLAQQLAEHGCIVSEYGLGMPPLAANFPRRNRIISGLARGVLVVEAAEQSGSLITARTALEQGRDVFAIPGSIHSPLSKGCHLLIKQGAKLVESVDDILDELGSLSARAIAPAATVSIDANDSALLQAIGFDPQALDVLSARSGLDAASLQAQLLTLELEGAVESLPGARYRRVN